MQTAAPNYYWKPQFMWSFENIEHFKEGVSDDSMKTWEEWWGLSRVVLLCNDGRERRKKRTGCMNLRAEWDGSDDRIKRMVQSVLVIMSWKKVSVYRVVTFDCFLLFWALFPTLNICEWSFGYGVICACCEQVFLVKFTCVCGPVVCQGFSLFDPCLWINIVSRRWYLNSMGTGFKINKYCVWRWVGDIWIQLWPC